MKDHLSGGLGLLGLLGAVILFVILRQIFPSLTTILLVIAGIALLCIASLVGLVLFFSLRKPKLKEGQGKAEHTAALLAGQKKPSIPVTQNFRGLAKRLWGRRS